MLMRLLIFIIISLSSIFASIVLHNHAQTYSQFNVSYLYDATSTLDIEDVQKQSFYPIPSQFALGYKEGNGWFKIRVKNETTDSRFILSFTEPFWSKFDFFEPIASGWHIVKNGLDIPLKNRTIQDPSPAFLININPGESKTYYIRGQSEGSHIGAFKIYTENEYFRPSRITLNTFYLFYTGILFIIVILNLLLWVEMKERIYGYYIGYVLSFILFISMFGGSYLILDIPGWNQGVHIVGGIVLIFMALFSSEFLQLKKYFSSMYRFFKLIVAIFIIFAGLIYLNVPKATLVYNIFSTFFVSLLLYLAIRTWIAGKIRTRYYLIALIIYMPSIGMMVMTFNNLLPNTNITRYSFLLGSLIEIILFSFILVSKFHKAKDEKIALQKVILNQKQKYQEHLENEIERQHKEIVQKNAILTHQSKHAAMGEMIELIAHQWRQPLNVLALINQDFYVKYHLGLCDKEYFEASHQQIDEYLQYMSKTIDDFRDYYNNDHIKQIENLEQIITAALHLSKVFLNYAHIKAEVIVHDSIEINIVRNELVQVLMTLIKNAHDVLVQKHISNGQITISVTKDNNTAIINVCDNGGGIPADIAKRIFEPYFTTKKGNGTGLGLYMSKNIIETSCNGTLTFHNTGEGVCFTIRCPLESTT